MERNLNTSLSEIDLFQIHPIVKNILKKDLIDDQSGVRTADNLPEWENMKIPSFVPDVYKPNLKYEQLNALLEKHKFDKAPLSFQELMNYAIIYSGVHPIDVASRGHAGLLNEYPASESFPFITGKFHGRRLPVRAIPPTFQDTDSLHTPFVTKGNNSTGVELFLNTGANEVSIGNINEFLPLDSPSVIAYIRQTKGPEHKDVLSITINPIFACGEQCAFCYRQYGLWGNTEKGALHKTSLVRIQPDIMARYITTKFKDVDFAQVKYIGVVTGTFKNFDDLYNYLVCFTGSLKNYTNGSFDVKQNNQGIAILTHLVTSKEQMLALKDVGVTELEHSLEMFHAEHKTKVIPVLTKNKNVTPKSSIKFDEVLEFIPDAIKIFGVEGFSSTAIIGLDDYNSTKVGLTKLKQAGLVKLSFPIYQTYNRDGMSLYRMSFEETIESRQLAKNLFIRQY